MEVDGLSVRVDFEEGKILLITLTLGLLEADGAALGLVLRSRVGVLVGRIDVVGTPEGRIDATTVGALLSTNVGANDLATLGALDGNKDGVTLGCVEGYEETVGNEDGLNVGDFEGAMDGSKDGVTLGCVEGYEEMVGNEDGLNVGDFDGLSDGNGVGGAGAVLQNIEIQD